MQFKTDQTQTLADEVILDDAHSIPTNVIPSFNDLLALCEDKLRSKDYLGTLESLNYVLYFFSTNEHLLNFRVHVLFLLGRNIEALPDLNQLIILNPHNTTALLERANLLQLQGDYCKAIEDLNRIYYVAPSDTLLSFRGELKRVLEDFDGALSDFDEALFLNPGNALALSGRGNIKRELGRYEWALADFDAALAIEPQNPSFLALRGDVHRHRGNYPQALADLTLSLSIKPDALALAWCGKVQLHLKDTKGAFQNLTQAYAMNRKNYLAMEYMGDLYVKLSQGRRDKIKHLQAAVSCYETAIKIKNTEVGCRKIHVAKYWLDEAQRTPSGNKRNAGGSTNATRVVVSQGSLFQPNSDSVSDDAQEFKKLPGPQ